MKKYSVIRNIYLYLFALIGLIMIITAAVDFIDMGLKAFVFTQAEQEEYHYRMKPPEPYALERAEKLAADEDVDLTADDKQAIKNWLSDYEEWKEQQESFDPIVAGRQKEASRNIAMLLIGLPLYLYHWKTIRKDKENA